MNEFWFDFYQVCEWLLILFGLAFFGVIIYIVNTALTLKTSVVRNVKRLYQPPVNSVKSLTATGKGIVMQEKVRVLVIAGQFKNMAGDVKDAATEIGAAAKTIHPEELKSAASNAQSTLRFAMTLVQMFRASSKQTP